MSTIDNSKLAAFRSLFGDDAELFDQVMGGAKSTNEMVERMKLVFRSAAATPAAEAPTTDAPAPTAAPATEAKAGAFLTEEQLKAAAAKAPLAQDIELDDAAIEAITRTAVAQFDAKLDPLAATLTNLVGMVERMAGNFGGMAERLQALEADDATKREQWRQDLPAKVATRTITHRPREQRGDDTPADASQIANKTLAGLPKVNFQK